MASGALVGVTRGPRLARRAFAAFGAAGFAAGFGDTGIFAAAAKADLRTSAAFVAGAAAFTGRTSAATAFFAAGFAATTGFFAGEETFFEEVFFEGAAARFADATARLGAAFAAGLVTFSTFFGAGFAGFAIFFGARFAGFAIFFGAGFPGFATFFGAGFTAFGVGFPFFGAGFTGFEVTFERFGAAAFFATGFATAFFAAGFNFFTNLDLLATLLPEVFIRDVVVDVLLFARAIVHSLNMR